MDKPDKIVEVTGGPVAKGGLNAQALGQTMEALRSKGKKSSGLFPRLRLAADIDISKADPECLICGGKGVARFREHTESRKGFRPKKVRIPVICACVVERSGIAKDALDSILDATSKKREEREAALCKARAEGREKEFLVSEARGGYNTLDATWVCQTCLKIERAPEMKSGVPTLPNGWGLSYGRAVCCDGCRHAYERKLVESGPDFAGGVPVAAPISNNPNDRVEGEENGD